MKLVGNDCKANISKRDNREFPISGRGLHQESEHNKHNDPGQTGHKPQQHGPSEQKH